jgi:HK97 family phage major capsid protein
MDPIIDRLHEQRLRAWEAAKAVLETADAEGRALTAEEETTYSDAIADVDLHDARLRDLSDAERRARELDEAFASIPERRAAEQAAPSVSDQIRALARGELRSVDVAPERRDLTKGTATAGGNAVPTSFYETLYEHLVEVSGVMQAGPTVLNTTSGETLEYPVTTAHSSAAIISEGSAITESDPAFAKRSLSAYKYANLIQVSRELLDDSGVDLEGYLARQAGRAVGIALGADLVTGNASSKPSGILQTSTLGKTGSASVSGAFSADDLVDLFYSVIAPYRASSSCAWMMDDATIAAVRKLKASTSGEYLWAPSMAVGQPDTLLGKPVVSDTNVPTVALSAKSVIFGDLAAYVVRMAGGVRFERSDEFAFSSDLVTFRCVLRADGILADQTGAVKHFAGNAA